MHDGERAAADAFGRPFARIGKRQRLLGPEENSGDEAADHQQGDAGSKRPEDGEDAEEQEIELINESATEPAGELALAGGAERQAEDRRAADQSRSAGAGAGFGDERSERTVNP